MVLVDTSVLIAFLRGDRNASTDRFQGVLDRKIPFGISPIIYQETLQGAKTEKDFKELKRYLDTQEVYSLKDERESYAAAAALYFACRRRGMTVGTIDCLIAQTAVENDLYLLHADSDFDRMGKLAGLKVFRG